jgi:hypothetical protein
MKIAVFWDVQQMFTSVSEEHNDCSFAWHTHDFEQGSILLHNICEPLLDYIVLHPRRQYSSYERQVTNASCWLQEIKSVEHQIQDVQQQYDQLMEQIQDKKNQMQQLQDAIKELDVQLEDGKLQHQKVPHSFTVLICILKNLLLASFPFYVSLWTKSLQSVLSLSTIFRFLFLTSSSTRLDLRFISGDVDLNTKMRIFNEGKFNTQRFLTWDHLN